MLSAISKDRASSGFWARNQLAPLLSLRQSRPPCRPSAYIVQEVVNPVPHNNANLVEAVKDLGQGSTGRAYVDDICITITRATPENNVLVSILERPEQWAIRHASVLNPKKLSTSALRSNSIASQSRKTRKNNNHSRASSQRPSVMG